MSLFGKILAFLNILAALAFFSLAAMDWGKRQAWAHDLYRHDLAIKGLPVNEDETDKDGVPWVEGLTQKTLQEMFQQVGGNPVKTQRQEVEAVRKRLQDRLEETDPKETKLQKQAKFLLPLAQSASRREWLIKTAAGQSMAAHGVFDPALEKELEANVDADKRRQMLETRLQEDFNGAFEQVLRAEVKSDKGDKKRDAGEQRRAIAGLLIALAELQPDDVAAGGSKDVLESTAYKRVLTVVGLETALKEVQAQADTLKLMVPGVIGDIEAERATFVGAYQKLFGQLQVLAEDIASRDQDLKRNQARTEKYQSVIDTQKKRITELSDKLKLLQEATVAKRAEQASLEARLLAEMKELRDTGAKNVELEKQIRKLEGER